MEEKQKQQQQQQQQQLPSLSPAACTSILLLLMPLLGACSSSPPALSPAEYCTSVMLSLADCLSFVEEGSNATKPEGSCCANLKEVVKAHVVCLCEGFKASSSLGLQLNMTRALALPAACRLSTPALSRCNIAAVTGVSPAPSPAAQFFANPPVRSPLAAGGVVMGAPAPSPATAEAATIQVAHASLLLGIAAVAALYY